MMIIIIRLLIALIMVLIMIFVIIVMVIIIMNIIIIIVADILIIMIILSIIVTIIILILTDAACSDIGDNVLVSCDVNQLEIPKQFLHFQIYVIAGGIRDQYSGNEDND